MRKIILLALLSVVSQTVSSCDLFISDVEAGPSYTQLVESDVIQMRLIKKDSIFLYSSSVDTPTNIRELRLIRDKLYILDAFDKFIKFYNRQGIFLYPIGRRGNGPGELDTPLSFDISDNRIWVVDVGRGKMFSVFNLNGAFIEQVGLPVPATTSPFEVVFAGHRMVTALPAAEAPEWHTGEIRGLVQVYDGRNKVLSGCHQDPRYSKSTEIGGLLSIYHQTDIAVYNEQVYCIQPISPVIQTIDLRTGENGIIDIAPPFYRPPQDRPMTMNQKDLFAFTSTWTLHRRIFPFNGGFASVYTRFDQKRGGLRHYLFLCTRNRSGYRCGVADDVPHPLFLTQAGELFVEEEPTANGPTQIGIYNLGE